MSNDFPHRYNHGVLVRVCDKKHPRYGEVGKIRTITRDTNQQRNPSGAVRYAISQKDGAVIYALEPQLEKE